MATLFDLAYKTMRELGLLIHGYVESGTNSTFTDTARDEPDDYWSGGAVFVKQTSDGLAPQSEFSTISDYSAGQFTLETALTAAIGANDFYGLADGKRITLDRVIQEINSAMLDLGPVPYTDTSLTTETGKREYLLPLAASRDLRAVSIQMCRDVYVENYTIQRNAIGDQDLLILPFDPDPGYTLKLEYVTLHPELHTHSDLLAQSVPVERVVYAAALSCAEWYNDYRKDAWFKDRAERLQLKLEAARRQRIVNIPPRRGRLLVLGDTVFIDYPGDRNPR